MKDQQYDYLFKIVLIGDSGVGKSNILSRFKDNKFTQESKPTIGVEFETKTINIDNLTIKTQIWDTAGQERFRAITNAYYKGAVGAIVVYDITKSKSFDNVKRWLQQLHDNADEKIMDAGNKLDLVDNRDVKTSTAQQYARQKGLLFIESSAATDINIKQVFHSVIRKIYSTVKSSDPPKIATQNIIKNKQKNSNNKVEIPISIDIKNPKVEDKKNCCGK